MITITKSTEFSAAHFYSQQKWDENRNLANFGKCFSKYGHGHDYRLEITISSSIANLEQDEKLLQSKLNEIFDELDHQHLNFMIPEFKNLIPTTENIANYVFRCFDSKMPHQQILKLKLYEKSDLFVQVTG